MNFARVLISVAMVSVLLAGYELVTTNHDGSSVCLVSTKIKGEPPKDPNADRFGFGEWYVNADRTIWVRNDSWRAGKEGNKVIWIRPAGTQLVVTGRRRHLDAPAQRLRVGTPCCYPTGFQVTGLYFPTGGCGEITAKADGKELRDRKSVV